MPARSARLRLVLTAGLLAIAAASCGGHGAPRSSAGPTSSTPGDATTPGGPAGTAGTVGAGPATTAGPPAPYTWSRSPSPALRIGGGASATLSALLPAEPGRGWLAAGTRTTASGLTTATVWSSADGEGWQADPLTAPNVPSQANGVAAWRTGVVVVGAVGQGANRQAAVWLSPTPGAPFSEVALTSAAGSVMDDVSAGTLGLFASGTEGGQVTIWMSPDGQRWVPSPNATKVIGGAADPVVSTVLASTDMVYAAGSVRSGTTTNAALWVSQDGLNWRLVGSAPRAFGGTGDRVITGLAPLGTGFVAVGGVRTGTRWSPASWISPDGASWSQPSFAFPIQTRAAAGQIGAVVRSLSAVPTLSGSTLLFAVGGTNTAQGAWTSTDGIHWSQVPLPAGAVAATGWRATLVASDGPTTVVADSDPGQPHLLVRNGTEWSEPSANPAVFGAVRPTAQPIGLARAGGELELTVRVETPSQKVGGVATSTRELRSTDGATWTAGSTPVASPVQLPDGAVAAARLGTRWVAVGQSVDPQPTRPSGLVTEGLAVGWTSSDGITWTAPRPLDASPGLAVEQPEALCVGGSTIVAVGTAEETDSGATTVAWWSADGIHWHSAPVGPTPTAGPGDEMAGCLRTTTGFVAYGAGSAAGGGDEPALWTSTDGARWARAATGSFGKSAPDPLTGLVRSGRTWFAVAPATADPDVGDGLLGVAPGLPEAGVWISTDQGGSWERLDQSSPVWQGADTTDATDVALVGGRVVITGAVDGQLAVWTGAPVATGTRA